MRRLLFCVALAAVLGGGVGATPASADDPPPILPPGVTTPASTPGVTPSNQVPPGPTYVITPGVGGSELPAPSDSKAVEEAKKSDQQAEQQAHQQAPAKGSPTPHAPKTVVQARTGGAVTGPGSDWMVVAVRPQPVGLLWRSMAGVVLMVVLFEITEVKRRLQRRRPAPA